jgi:pilus assembly protein CpaC
LSTFIQPKFRATRGNAGGRWLPALALAVATVVAAQERAFQATAEAMKLSVGRSVVLDRTSDVARISVSNPDVVDAVAVTTREILINAKSAGEATLVIWPKTGGRTIYAVTVERDLQPIRRLLKETFPEEAIDVRADRDSLALVGRASSQGVADRALALLAPLAKTVVGNLQVMPAGAEKQIVLRVKFAEIQRSVASSFGVSLLSTGAANTPGRITTQQFASGSPGSVNGTIPGHLAGAATNFSLSDVLNIFAFRPDLNLGAVIQDLQARGVLQILAEPNLVTTNGKEASFLVGGEFPVPVPQAGSSAGAITISFREFGIKLSFTPQVTANRTIKMHVKPEVSSIDLANGIVFAGFSIPALSTRRMETDIELGEGQSFVIAGLLDDRVTQNLSQIPGLSHLPIFGALFKSRSESKSKTELLVMVTPESVYPLASTDPKPTLNMPRPFLPNTAPKRSLKEERTPAPEPRSGLPAIRPISSASLAPGDPGPEAASAAAGSTAPAQDAKPVAEDPNSSSGKEPPSPPPPGEPAPRPEAKSADPNAFPDTSGPTRDLKPASDGAAKTAAEGRGR